MPSNASRGALAKGRTKKYLIAQGYTVADMEKVLWIHGKNGRVPIKRDQWGCDLIAKNASEFLFVQVKSGNIAGNFPDAIRKFNETVWPVNFDRDPAMYRRLIIAWAPRSRAPRIVEC